MRRALALGFALGLLAGAGVHPNLVPNHTLDPVDFRWIALLTLATILVGFTAKDTPRPGLSKPLGALAFCLGLAGVLAFGHTPEPPPAEPSRAVVELTKPKAPTLGPNQFDELMLDRQTRTIWRESNAQMVVQLESDVTQFSVGLAGLKGASGSVELRLEAGEQTTWVKSYDVSNIQPSTWTDIHVDVHKANGPRRLVAEITSTGRDSSIFLSRPALIKATVKGPKRLILISIDTLRSDFLGSYGFERWPTSPALDRLASEGTLFEQAIAPSSWTIPSHMAVFTGRAPDELGLGTLIDDVPRLDPGIRSLADAFSDAGYLSVAFTGTGTLSSIHGFADGFYLQQEAKRDINQPASADLDHNIYAARTWLQDQADVPLFLFFHTFEVHAPYTHNRFMRQDSTFRSMELERATYASGIAYTDELIGQFLETLTELGMMDDTVVVVMSDHGEAFNEHGTTRHGLSLYDEVVKVPLILWGEGIPSGRRVAAQVGLTDLTATFADLFQLKMPNDMTSVSLTNHLTSEVEERDVFLCCTAHKQRMWGVRNSAAKYVLTEKDGAEFYNLGKDPGEQTNLIDQDPEKAKPLGEAVRARMASIQASEKPEIAPIDMDDEHMEELRQLGYVE